MPEGQYFSAHGMISAGAGGQTRALLMRNRLLVQRAGIEPTLLTFDNIQDYPRVRGACVDSGQLFGPMRLLNIYEWYRETDLDDLPATGDRLPELEDSTRSTTPVPGAASTAPDTCTGQARRRRTRLPPCGRLGLFARRRCRLGKSPSSDTSW